MDKDKIKLVEKIKKHIDDYNTGYLEMSLGYKFRTKQFLDVLFLYTNSVDVKNPDILGSRNKNTFIYEAQSSIRKVKEQIRLDIKDINFMIEGAMPLSRFIPKAANRKVMKDNNFATTLDEIPDNAVDYGSGYLKVWKTSDGKIHLKSIDPYYMIFNQYNFKDGLKTEKFTRTIREVIEDEKYDVNVRAKLKQDTEDKDLDNQMVLYQTVQDLPDGSQRVTVTDPYAKDAGLVFYDYTTKEKLVKYYKYDLEKRKGFPDALGVGFNERIFNKLVQSKVNRERLDKVLAIASKLAFQKQIDNERDNMVGKDFVDLEDGVILGHKGNPLSPLNTDGAKQVTLLRNEIVSVINSIGNDLNTPEALQGNTLPSGTSGVLGNLLTENASSVLKEFKKSYANFIDYVYSDSILKYILDNLQTDDNLQKYLTPNDYRLVKLSVRKYLVALKFVDSVINNTPFDRATAEAEADRELGKKKIIPGELLKKLREEMEGITTYISGENVSKAQAVSFLNDLQAKYLSNPQALKDPFIKTLITRVAEYDAGISSLEVEQLFEEMPE